MKVKDLTLQQLSILRQHGYSRYLGKSQFITFGNETLESAFIHYKEPRIYLIEPVSPGYYLFCDDVEFDSVVDKPYHVDRFTSDWTMYNSSMSFEHVLKPKSIEFCPGLPTFVEEKIREDFKGRYFK